jgi:hypothetical protein
MNIFKKNSLPESLYPTNDLQIWIKISIYLISTTFFTEKSFRNMAAML